jgi:hypothetical protein
LQKHTKFVITAKKAPTNMTDTYTDADTKNSSLKNEGLAEGYTNKRKCVARNATIARKKLTTHIAKNDPMSLLMFSRKKQMVISKKTIPNKPLIVSFFPFIAMLKNTSFLLYGNKFFNFCQPNFPTFYPQVQHPQKQEISPCIMNNEPTLSLTNEEMVHITPSQQNELSALLRTKTKKKELAQASGENEKETRAKTERLGKIPPLQERKLPKAHSTKIREKARDEAKKKRVDTRRNKRKDWRLGGRHHCGK